MSETLEATVVRPENWTFYQKHILRLLREMRQGHMTLTLPDGYRTSWGEREADISARLTIKDVNFFKRCLLYGDIGFGESYMAGEWETDDLPMLLRWMILNIENHPAMSGSSTKSLLNLLSGANRWLHRIKPNNRKGSQKNIEAHYDLSNDFFATFLDSTMTYSSAFFKTGGESLEEAQRAKFEKLAQKLKLQSSDHLLEIGSGWGAFAVYAAENFGCKVTTLTVSKQQLQFVADLIRRKGLTGRIEIRYQDYRDVSGQFDKIVSIEMLEAVGHEFLEPYFAKCHEVLKPHGLLALQVITCPDSRYDQFRKSVDWIQKHIFPGSLLPSISAITQAINRTGDLSLHNLEDLTPHYVKTLRAWRENFKAKHSEIASMGFNGIFQRKWDYYFSYCEAAFGMRNISVVQMLYTRPNNLSL